MNDEKRDIIDKDDLIESQRILLIAHGETIVKLNDEIYKLKEKINELEDSLYRRIEME